MTDEDKITVHIASATQYSDIPEQGPDECPDCKVPTEGGYGLMGSGMGVYIYCPGCGKILSKVQTGDL